MPRKKTPIFLLIAVTLAAVVFLFSGEGVDEDLVQTLQRQSDQNAASTTAADPAPTNEFRRLTPETTMTHATRNSWTVESTKTADSTTYVRLPFDPAVGIEQQSAGESESPPATTANPGFMGSDACAECHQEKHRGFAETSHHRTSRTLTPGACRGSFDSPDNLVNTTDPELFFTMDQSDGQLVQQVTLSDWSFEIPMDIVFGSSKVGQSFLYWHGNALYQAHISYLTQSDGWIPSPGFADTAVTYTRTMSSRCLECHVTYIERVKRPNHYNRDSVIWGISCERCHGPGREHVEFHREHPQEKDAKHIIYPRDLPRQRQLDICGQCHSGGFTLRKKAFSYRPGDDLHEFHQHVESKSDKVGGIHTSDQLQRLQKSRCFQQSQMTCTTCHNPHKNQRGEIAAFTQSCLGCHQSDHCGMATQLGERVSQDCISCHMPIAENVDMADVGDLQTLMADHYIRVDQTATQRYLAK